MEGGGSGARGGAGGGFFSHVVIITRLSHDVKDAKLLAFGHCEDSSDPTSPHMHVFGQCAGKRRTRRENPLRHSDNMLTPHRKDPGDHGIEPPTFSL